jgi:hypothetical protein
MAVEEGVRGWRAGVRALPRGVLLALGLLAATILQQVLTALGAPAWVRYPAAVEVFALAVSVEWEKWRVARREQIAAARAAEEAWERAARGALRRWPPLPAAEEDPYSLGVARSRLTAGFAKGEPPAPYLGRDADQEYKKWLRAHGRVLLIGEPASGGTQTAFEAVTAVWEHLLVVAADPDRPDASGMHSSSSVCSTGCRTGGRCCGWTGSTNAPPRVTPAGLSGFRSRFSADLDGE